MPENEGCRFNHGIICSMYECDKCGWNPEEIGKRTSILRAVGLNGLKDYIRRDRSQNADQ